VEKGAFSGCGRVLKRKRDARILSSLNKKYLDHKVLPIVKTKNDKS
jgi:hypothetical protein